MGNNCKLYRSLFFGDKLMKKYLVFLLLFVFSPCFADGPYYVDNEAMGSNNGSSWTNAWNSFASINWATVAGGTNRTVYISGGTTSKTYAEGLRITSSGTSGNPIIVAVGQASPHNGIVIIDPNFSSGVLAGVWINGVSYVTVSGQIGSGTGQNIKVQKCRTYALYVSDSTDHMDLGYIEFTNNGATSNSVTLRLNAAANARLGDIHHCKIHDNHVQNGFFTESGTKNTGYDSFKFYNNEGYNFQSKFIQGYISGTSFYNNTIHDRWTALHDYSDIFYWQGRYAKIYNNTIYNVSRDNNTVQPTAWASETAYNFGDTVSPLASGAYKTAKRYWSSYQDGACTSGVSEPDWSACLTDGQTCNDGTCTWKSKMGIANADGTWWPSDWAMNANIKYAPTGTVDADPQYVMVYNNLFYETVLPRTSPATASAQRALEFSVSDNTLTSVRHIYIMNNTIVGVPLEGLSFQPHSGLTSSTLTDIVIENNIWSNIEGFDPENQDHVIFTKGDGTITIGKHGSGENIIFDYNQNYASSASYSNTFSIGGTRYTYDEFVALNSGGVTTPNLSGWKTDLGLDGSYKPTGQRAGVDLSSFFTVDKDGVTKTSWTIGAYEYGGGLPPASAPLTGGILTGGSISN
jgi:hypothetical protein